MVELADDAQRRTRALPGIVLLFIGSGCAALIYEIVWFQLLQFVIGASAISLAVLLAAFMGGMCLGSYLLPRWLPVDRHPLRIYAALELLIGICGLVILYALPLLNGWYVAVVSGSVTNGWTAITWRAVMACVALLPPTMLMGATLPAVARWVEATPRGSSWLGFFYGGNLAGAVLGCLLAGFYLLRWYDLATATYVAVGINLVIALVAWWLAGTAQGVTFTSEQNRTPSIAPPLPAQRAAWPIYLAIAFSGLSALGAEVTWTRLLSLLIGGTVYTFSIILAVFLVGLGIGSTIGSLLARRGGARVLLAACQLMLTLAIFWTAYQVTRSLPYWPINPALTENPWLQWQLDIVRCSWALLPPAILWGTSFPLALAAVAATRPCPAVPADHTNENSQVPDSGLVEQAADAGRVAGDVYAANTVGAILGALLFSLVFIPGAGTWGSQRLLIAIPVASALILGIAELRARPQRWFIGLITTAIIAVGAGWLMVKVPATPGDLIAYGRYTPRYHGQAELLFLGEGLNSSVAVTLRNGVERSFHVSGKVEASSLPQDMRLQRMLGHIPALVHPQPKSVLIVGCGAGVTAGSFIMHPGIERIVICELEPLIPQVVARHFEYENHAVVTNPRVEIVYDDARHFILTTTEQFDIITSDPIHPWVRGAASLYTREYFELCKRRLKPGGIVTQWVPLYESNSAAVKSELATFFDAFPHGSVWSNDHLGTGYDVVLLGQSDPLSINLDQFSARLARDDHWFVTLALEDVGFYSAYDLLATYSAQAADLADWLSTAQRNQDRNLRLQYLAAIGASEYQEDAIYREIVKRRQAAKLPFVGTPDALAELKHRWENPTRVRATKKRSSD